MKFFVDGTDIEAIKTLSSMGLVDGVTTNPSLIAQSDQKITHVLEQICKYVKGPVSAEVVAEDLDSMMQEADALSKIAPQIAIKVPLTQAGLQACVRLREQGIQVNVTLCFSTAQALLAAKAGATFISPFVGRLDDTGADGLALIQQIVETYRNYPALTTEILVASVRNIYQIIAVAEIGAHVVTAPAPLLLKMLEHPLTNIGLKKFLDDWKKTGQTIA